MNLQVISVDRLKVYSNNLLRLFLSYVMLVIRSNSPSNVHF